jgi:hypothetical protein
MLLRHRHMMPWAPLASHASGTTRRLDLAVSAPSVPPHPQSGSGAAAEARAFVRELLRGVAPTRCCFKALPDSRSSELDIASPRQDDTHRRVREETYRRPCDPHRLSRQTGAACSSSRRPPHQRTTARRWPRWSPPVELEGAEEPRRAQPSCRGQRIVGSSSRPAAPVCAMAVLSLGLRRRALYHATRARVAVPPNCDTVHASRHGGQ